MSKTATSLENELIKLISANGPISLAQYMGECLGHPKHGYYMNKDPFGVEGDFTTAPEVSQMFGEMLGMWVANQWQETGSHTPVKLIELGPGRGTLMADILRVLNIVPILKENLSVHLVEISPALMAAQKEKINQNDKTPIYWHKTIADVPDGFSFIIANEFFDALPVHQFEMTNKGWLERVVEVDENSLTPRLAAASPALFMADEGFRKTAKLGDIIETSPVSITIMAEVSRRIKEHGGAGLIIDYGYNKTAFGDSVQATKNHDYCNLFETPSQADITAHVNFEILAKCAKECGLQSFGATEQGIFLKQLGIEMRAEKLSKVASPQQKQDIATAIKRLTGDDEMGKLFKILAVQNKNLPTPIGFE
jgi:NADH dehydrogenase [ubiquinone] 1 alpha subcomplex assembly factor 7